MFTVVYIAAVYIPQTAKDIDAHMELHWKYQYTPKQAPRITLCDYEGLCYHVIVAPSAIGRC